MATKVCRPTPLLQGLTACLQERVTTTSRKVQKVRTGHAAVSALSALSAFSILSALPCRPPSSRKAHHGGTSASRGCLRASLVRHKIKVHDDPRRALTRSRRTTMKRLVICMDGTWNDADRASADGQDKTNV